MATDRLPSKQQQVKSRYLDYVIGMGIDRHYLTSAYAVPHEEVLVSERSDIIRYGIDTRKFAETSWFKIDTATVRLTKTAMQVDGAGAVRITRIDLACGPTGALTLLVTRDLANLRDKSDAVTVATRETWVKVMPLPGYKTPAGGKLSLEPRLGIVPPNFLDLAVRARLSSSRRCRRGARSSESRRSRPRGWRRCEARWKNACRRKTTAPAKSASH